MVTSDECGYPLMLVVFIGLTGYEDNVRCGTGFMVLLVLQLVGVVGNGRLAVVVVVVVVVG